MEPEDWGASPLIALARLAGMPYWFGTVAHWVWCLEHFLPKWAARHPECDFVLDYCSQQPHDPFCKAYDPRPYAPEEDLQAYSDFLLIRSDLRAWQRAWEAFRQALRRAFGCTEESTDPICRALGPRQMLPDVPQWTIDRFRPVFGHGGARRIRAESWGTFADLPGDRLFGGPIWDRRRPNPTERWVEVPDTGGPALDPANRVGIDVAPWPGWAQRVFDVLDITMGPLPGSPESLANPGAANAVFLEILRRRLWDLCDEYGVWPEEALLADPEVSAKDREKARRLLDLIRASEKYQLENELQVQVNRAQH